MANKTFLKIAAGEWIPWTRIFVQDDGKVTIHGPLSHVLAIISDKQNFDYELLRPEKNLWGVLGSDGNWSGMMGMVHREEVDMAVGPFAVTKAREDICDFSNFVYLENFGILMVRPSLQNDLSGFLKPFVPDVWILVLLSAILVCSLFALSLQQEKIVFNHNHRNITAKSVIWVLKALTQESSENLPKGNTSRTVIATWLLASLVFMSSYGGILTAMLTVPKVSIPIDSMEDLVAQNDLPWRMAAGSMMYQYFQEATDGVRKMVFDGHSGSFQDCWDAKELISQGEFAAFCDRTTMTKALSWDFSTTASCHLYIAREPAYSNVMISMAYRTNSPYKPIADVWIQRIKEAGLFGLWLRNEFANTSQCLRPPSSDKSFNTELRLDLQAFAGPLLVLIGGLILGFAALLIENLSACVLMTW